MIIHEIPAKMTTEWNDDIRAIIDTVYTFMLSLEEFETAVLTKGLPFAEKRNGQAWIVDSSRATGIFIKEIQDFIDTVVFPAFKKSGIKYFITVNTSNSILAQRTVDVFSNFTPDHNLRLVQVSSITEAIDWLKSRE